MLVFLPKKTRHLFRKFGPRSVSPRTKQQTALIKLKFMSIVSFRIPAAHRTWALIYVAGESSCRSVQYIIRPHFHAQLEWINYMLGVAPNLLAGIYVPACFTFLMPYLTEQNHTQRDYNPQRYMWPACAFAMTGLLGWEFLQPFTRHFVFDPHDVLWTFIGVGTYTMITQWRTSGVILPANRIANTTC